jgi:hypothetical protein
LRDNTLFFEYVKEKDLPMIRVRFQFFDRKKQKAIRPFTQHLPNTGNNILSVKATADDRRCSIEPNT